MFEAEETKNLMCAVESVEFVQNKREGELLAKEAGIENTDSLKRMRFAEDLRNQLRDLFYDSEGYGHNMCPPAKINWIDACEKTESKTHLASIVHDAIEQAFRCGYYYAMAEGGGRWQPSCRFNDEYLNAIGMELVPSKPEFDEDGV